MGTKFKKLFLVSVLLLLVLPNVPTTYAQAITPTPGGPCTSVIPTTAPNLYQVDAASDSAIVYFTPPSSGFDGFTISYGLDSTAASYNATLSQGPTTGAVSYTINSLSPNTTYYFKVRANNGCAPGPWSNVSSATTSSNGSTLGGNSGNTTVNTTGSTKTPVTGPEDVVYFGLAALLLSLGGFGIFLKNK